MTRNLRHLLVVRAAVFSLVLATVTSQAANYWWNGTTNNWNSQNWESPSGTPTAAIPGNWDSVYNTKGGKAILTTYRDPGYFQFASGELEILTGGTLSPAGSGGGLISAGPATITINGGTFTGIGPIGPNAAGAVVNLTAGNWTKAGSDNFYARLGGRINHTGGTLAVGAYSLVLGQQDAWGHSNGDYYLGDASASAGTFTGSGSLIVGNITNKMNGAAYQRTTYGTFTGWGTVGLTGTLRNNGYITANGYGTDRTLDLSRFTTVTNTVGNDEYKLSGDNNFYYGKGGTGWFAANGGKLMLPSVSVATGANSYNWGEAAADTQIDLINSVNLAFNDIGAAGGGTLSVSLLATDRTDLGKNAFNADTLALYDFDTSGGFAFDGGSVVLTFRYDDVLAASLGLTEADLNLWHREAGAWVNITASVDTANHLITTIPISSFSMFAAAIDSPIAIPEPASFVMLGFAGLALLRRRRR